MRSASLGGGYFDVEIPLSDADSLAQGGVDIDRPDERLWTLLSSVEELLDHEVRHRFPEAGVTETSFGGANPVIEPGAVYAMTRRMALMGLRV